MTKAKMPKRRFWLVGLIVWLVVQVAWLGFFYSTLDRDYTRTTATVIGYSAEDCPIKAKCPKYEFQDSNGKVYTDSDWFEPCGYSNGVCRLFWPDVGDKVAAYYPKAEPDKPLFLHFNPLTQDMRLLPTYAALVITVVAFVVIYLKKHLYPRKQKTKPGERI